MAFNSLIAVRPSPSRSTTVATSSTATITAPVAATEPKKRSRFYRPELDALRFFAFFWVYCFHFVEYPASFFVAHGVPAFIAYPLTNLVGAGVFGVDLFFTLSSYLITELLLREKEEFGRVNVRDFYIRRILRIWPLYFAFLAVAMIPAVNVDHVLTWKYLACFLLLMGNWSTILFGWPGRSVTGPLWTISIEEQFYLAWPPVVARLSRRGIFYTACGMLATSTLFRVVLVFIHGNKYSIWRNTFTRLDPIAAGIILAVLLHGQTLRLKWFSRLSLWLGGLFIVVCVFPWRIYDPASLEMLPNLLGFPLLALGCSLLLLSVLGVQSKIPAPLIYLGKISYGLYVLHDFGVFLTDKLLPVSHGTVHALLRIGLSLPITITLAAFSYHFLESPFLRLKGRFTRVASRPV
jgi:peptidoglycan/LPS O-acetylase OafA/YrhL